ncbi:MAG: molybdopterin cofactor-binding domain-containing protein, partial [Pseudomonadota bacterium]
MKNQRFGVGQPVRRTEDVRFLTGAGGYLDDLPFEAVRHMAILRSPVAHGRIRSISTEAATIEGVDLIYTFADIRGRLSPITSTMPLIQSDGTPFLQAGLPHLADDMVRFVGQPIAVVVAADPHLAQDAVEQIEVDIEERPALVDPMSAMTSPAIHPDVPHNRLYDWEMGDLAGADEALARADHVVRIEVTNQRIAVNAIEPRGIIATYDAETGWEVWVGNQGVHAAKRGLIADLAVHADRVRVHAPDIGGGFGMKLMNHPEYGLAALAAQDLGLPVKWIATRSEGFLSDVQARDLRTVAEAGFDRRGRLKGLRWSSVSNMGAYTSNAGMGVHTSFSANLIGGVYDVAHVHHRVQGVLTTTPPTDAYRGAGRPEVLHVMERLMSQAAQELGLDQVEIRRRNLIRPEQIPYRTQGGITFDALDALGTLERAAELADVDGFGSRPGLRGLGVAYYFERTGGSPVEHTRFTLTPD